MLTAAYQAHARIEATASIRCVLSTLFALLLLLYFSDIAEAADRANPTVITEAAETNFQEAVSRYRSGDFQTSFSIFSTLSDTGHAGARYYLGIMYALGQGAPRNWELAYKWLSCVADGAKDRDLRVDASRQRAVVKGKLSSEFLQRARRLAKQECRQDFVSTQEDGADRLLYNPTRATLADQLIFSAGDLIMMSVMIVAQRTHLKSMQNAAMAVYALFGDWFIGVLSVLWWLLFGRVLYLLWGTGGGLSGRRQSETVARNIARPKDSGSDQAGR